MQLIINGVPTEVVDPRLEALESLVSDIRSLIKRHEELASGENSHYYELLDELHHLVRTVTE